MATLQPAHHSLRKKTGSEKVRAAGAARVKSRPTIVLERMPSRQALVLTGDKHLLVDPRVQRVDIVTTMVQELSTVLLANGTILDPVKIAERPDGILSIVDGQQRYWAFVNCKIEKFPAIIYKTDGDIDTERKMFQIFNRHIVVNANTITKSWPGPVGEAIRQLESHASSPLHGMIGLGNPGRRPLEASILAKGLLCAVTGVTWGGAIERVLTRIDTELVQSSSAKARIAAYAKLMADIFVRVKGERPRVRTLMAQAIGVVAHRRWASGTLSQPAPRVLSTLRRVRWDKVAPSWANKYLVNYVDRVERIWV